MITIVCSACRSRPIPHYAFTQGARVCLVCANTPAPIPADAGQVVVDGGDDCDTPYIVGGHGDE